MNKRTPSLSKIFEVTKSPVKRGDTIQLIVDDEVWYTTKVVAPLSKQFTCLVNKKVKFFFYEDRGVTWQTTRG